MAKEVHWSDRDRHTNTKIEALELLKKYASSKTRHYDSTEEIPIDGVLKAGAKEILMETDSDGNERINRAQAESLPVVRSLWLLASSKEAVCP